jgi:quercetin dioxygenase-like cupin family protein
MSEEMKDFPGFMKSPANRIENSSQFTDDIEGYFFEAKDGQQMAFWTCFKDRTSKEHIHDFDEYMIVAHGEYTVEMNDASHCLAQGDEIYIPQGTKHSGKAKAGTRTIHCFGGKRVKSSVETP